MTDWDPYLEQYTMPPVPAEQMVAITLERHAELLAAEAELERLRGILRGIYDDVCSEDGVAYLTMEQFRQVAEGLSNQTEKEVAGEEEE